MGAIMDRATVDKVMELETQARKKADEDIINMVERQPDKFNKDVKEKGLKEQMDLFLSLRWKFERSYLDSWVGDEIIRVEAAEMRAKVRGFFAGVDPKELSVNREAKWDAKGLYAVAGQVDRPKQAAITPNKLYPVLAEPDGAEKDEEYVIRDDFGDKTRIRERGCPTIGGRDWVIARGPVFEDIVA